MSEIFHITNDFDYRRSRSLWLCDETYDGETYDGYHGFSVKGWADMLAYSSKPTPPLCSRCDLVLAWLRANAPEVYAVKTSGHAHPAFEATVREAQRAVFGGGAT